jgi:hypothetical protein
MSNEPLRVLLELLERLNRSQILCHVAHYRDDAISIEVVVPGQRWEIDVLVDGTVEVEVFSSNGIIQDEQYLDTLIETFTD